MEAVLSSTAHCVNLDCAHRLWNSLACKAELYHWQRNNARDFDEAQGTLSVTKSRVYGVDKNMTKTREDRVFPLCPRAIAVLRRQLALYLNLRSRGRVDHHQLFFGANGAPIRTFNYLAKCWRQSSTRLGLRFRRPYCARHTSVSWNLMIGKNPLRVSEQHGHSLTTMFRTYAAWVRGATESDIPIIRSAMNSEQSAADLACAQQVRPKIAPVARLVTRLATEVWAPEAQMSDFPGEEEWRRGWDSNPRAGITRPSDFESAPL